MNIEEIRLKYQTTGNIVEEEVDFLLHETARLTTLLTRAEETKQTLAEECERLTERAATHLADQDLLVAQERKRVARDCADMADDWMEYVEVDHAPRKAGAAIRAKYGVEE